MVTILWILSLERMETEQTEANWLKEGKHEMSQRLLNPTPKPKPKPTRCDREKRQWTETKLRNYSSAIFSLTSTFTSTSIKPPSSSSSSTCRRSAKISQISHRHHHQRGTLPNTSSQCGDREECLSTVWHCSPRKRRRHRRSSKNYSGRRQMVGRKKEKGQNLRKQCVHLSCGDGCVATIPTTTTFKLVTQKRTDLVWWYCCCCCPRWTSRVKKQASYIAPSVESILPTFSLFFTSKDPPVNL